MLHFFRQVKRYFWIIIITTFVLGGTVYLMDSFYLDRMYESSSTLYVFQDPEDKTSNAYQGLLASEMIVQDFREMIKTGIVLQDVKNTLKADIPWIEGTSLEDLSDMITVDIKSETRIVQVTVTTIDSGASALIANTISEVFKSKIAEMFKLNNVIIIDMAQAASVPISPVPRRDTMLAAVAGIILGISIILFVDHIRMQIISEQSGDVLFADGNKAVAPKKGKDPHEQKGVKDKMTDEKTVPKSDAKNYSAFLDAEIRKRLEK